MRAPFRPVPRAVRFRIIVAKQVDAAVRDAGTPRRVRQAFVAVHHETSERGCSAAHYRLSGPSHGAGHGQAKPACCSDENTPPFADDAELMSAIDEIVRSRR
jgi:hypothetical protein